MGRARGKGVYMRAHDNHVEVVEARAQGMGLLDLLYIYIYIYLAQEFEFQYIHCQIGPNCLRHPNGVMHSKHEKCAEHMIIIF